MKANELETIVRAMTLEEKAALCSGADFWNTCAVERLGVPALTMSDGPSGLRKQDGSGKMGLHESKQSISFPTGSLMAASFDPELLTKLGETLGEEARSEDIDILLGPAMNIKRSPLCGRNFEYYSEDPYLSSTLATAYVNGLQSKGVGACPKHFYANNMENRRMTVSSELDERTAREIYLASFEKTVKESHPRSIMCSYNKINGVYAAQNKDALTDILRGEWGFDGMVVSDWGAVNDRAADLAAGLDLEMPSSHGSGPRRILEAMQDGTLDEAALDTACLRILKAACKCKETPEESACDWAEHHRIAADFAAESMVLLKNEGLLPLDPAQKAAFIGKYAKEPRYQGGGSSHVHPWKVESALDCITEETVTYAQGFDDATDETDAQLLREAVRAAQQADVAVLFVGLPEHYESEGFDREHLKMPPNQLELIREVCKVQKNVVVLLHNGAPIEMPWLHEVGAVLECYLGGEGVGRAQLDLLYGRKNPCGRLAETFPVKLEDNPSYLNFCLENNKVHYREGVFVGYRWYTTAKQAVLFPFGHGLSYTTFQYDAPRVEQSGETVCVTVDVTNTGAVAGKEVVQLYICPPKSEVRRPLRKLKAVAKIALNPGESKTVRFTLERRAFAYWSEEIHGWRVEGGSYQMEFGRSSMDIAVSAAVEMAGDALPRRIITRDTAIGDLTDEQIDLVMSSFGKRAQEKKEGDKSVSSIASRALQVNMPLRSLVSFGAMKEDGLEKMLATLNRQENV